MNVGTGGMGEANVAIDDDFFGAGGAALDAEAVAYASFIEGARAGEFGDFAVAGEK